MAVSMQNDLRIRRGDVYKALGLKGETIPPDLEGTFEVHVVPEAPLWYREYHGPLVVTRATGAYAKHRIFVPCDCGKLVPFGRITQHRCKPKPEPFGGSHAPDCPYRNKGECLCWRSDPDQNPDD